MKTPSTTILRGLPILSGLLFAAAPASADASYQESVQITGGSLVDTIRSVPFIPHSMKKMFDPVNSLTMLHGNQLASVSKLSTQIIDLDQETITRIDNEKKTYTVVTFAQMRQAVKEAPKQLEAARAKAEQARPAPPPAGAAPAANLQVTFDVSLTDPNVSKVVNGVMAKEQILTLKAHVTDLSAPAGQGGNTMTYNYVMEVWSAPEPPELKEIAAFYQRYGAKMMQGVDAAALMKAMKPALDGSALAPLFATQPGMGAAMQEMAKKMAVERQKITGTPILEVTRLGGDTMLTSTGTTGAAGSAAGGSGSEATQAVGNATADAAAAAADRLGSIGSAFGRSLAGAFRHIATTPASSSATVPSAAAAPGTPPNSVMFETTTQKSAFSEEAIPPSAFQVPDGFAKVASPYDGLLQK